MSVRRNGYKAVIPLVSGIAYVAKKNPMPMPGAPIEVTTRSERIGSKSRDLAPGVRMISQISRTEKEVWVTHGEQRLFLYLQDEQGRGSYFYQSFAGTGGKAQGFWFPSGGVMADPSGSGVWVIKGNPKTDPGAGREGLLALYEKANAVLPQSDADTDAWLMRLVGMDYGDISYKDEYEIKATLRLMESGAPRDLQAKWGGWAYQFWALNALDKTWGKRISGSASMANPEDLAGRHIPERYLAGLPPKLQQQRVRELTRSRDAYKMGDYSELPTDVTARKMGLVKQSAYTTVAKARGIEWRGDPNDMAARVLVYYGGRPSAREIAALSEALSATFRKGLAAWKSGGHRPGATAQNWAVARVNSLVVGGKAAWTADRKQFASMREAIRGAITSQMGAVLKALAQQNRQNDVEFLRGHMTARENPLTTSNTKAFVLEYPYGNDTFSGWVSARMKGRARSRASSAGSAVQRRHETQEEVGAAGTLAGLDYVTRTLEEADIRELMALSAKPHLTDEEAERRYLLHRRLIDTFEAAKSRAYSGAEEKRHEEEVGQVVGQRERRSAQLFERRVAGARRRLNLLGVKPTDALIAGMLNMDLSEYNRKRGLSAKPRYASMDTEPTPEQEPLIEEAGSTSYELQLEDKMAEIKRMLARESLVEAAQSLLGEKNYLPNTLPGLVLEKVAQLYALGIDPESPEGRLEIGSTGMKSMNQLKALLADVQDTARPLLQDKVELALGEMGVPRLLATEGYEERRPRQLASPERKLLTRRNRG